MQRAPSLPSWAPPSAAAAGLPGRGGGAGAGGAAGPAARAPVGAPPGAAGPPAGPWAGAEGRACLRGAWGSLRTHRGSRVSWKVCLQGHGYSLIGLLQAHLTQNDKTCSMGLFLTLSSPRPGPISRYFPFRFTHEKGGHLNRARLVYRWWDSIRASGSEHTAFPPRTLPLQAGG